MDLEKTYWGLKGSGKFDLETFEKYACPPVPEELCEGNKVVSTDIPHTIVLWGGKVWEF